MITPQSIKTKIDLFLSNYLTGHPSPSPLLNDALAYSVLTPGKRLRPYLVYGTAEYYGAIEESILPIASALELIHCYSLVHDDLPAMDNSPLRHGRPTCHKVYGDALGVLVGDALIPLAFEMMVRGPYSDSMKASLVLSLTQASGQNGMVSGQVMDILSPETPLTFEEICALQELKTGALLACACEMGGILGGQSPEILEKLRTYGYLLGLIYQGTDDILDATAHADDIGKPTGQDVHKKTILSYMSIQEAREYMETLAEKARALNLNHLFLDQFLDQILLRTR